MRKIIVFYEQSNYIRGFRLFDAKDTCVLEIGILTSETKKEILLEEDDRIVGFRSRLYASNQALHNGLVIVI